jgi:hypothetical protein
MFHQLGDIAPLMRDKTLAIKLNRKAWVCVRMTSHVLTSPALPLKG